MKQLIFVRHGDYDDNHRLTQAGRERLRLLAGMLWEEIKGMGEIIVLASTAPRAAESADVICEVLEVSRRADHECLWRDDNHHPIHNADLELVRSWARKSEVIIVVGHLPHRSLLTRYAKQDLGFEMGGEYPETGYGCAQVLDVATKQLSQIG